MVNEARGIIFGDPDKPKATGHFYDDDLKIYGIEVFSVLDTNGLNPGDVVSFDNIGDSKFVIAFKTKTSVENMIDHLNCIKKMMEENKN